MEYVIDLTEKQADRLNTLLLGLSEAWSFNKKLELKKLGDVVDLNEKLAAFEDLFVYESYYKKFIDSFNFDNANLYDLIAKYGIVYVTDKYIEYKKNNPNFIKIQCGDVMKSEKSDDAILITWIGNNHLDNTIEIHTIDRNGYTEVLDEKKIIDNYVKIGHIDNYKEIVENNISML